MENERDPRTLSRFVTSWKTLHPDYTFMFWTDEDNLSLIQRNYPDLLDIYEHSNPCDEVRLCAIRYSAPLRRVLR